MIILVSIYIIMPDVSYSVFVFSIYFGIAFVWLLFYCIIFYSLMKIGEHF